jgi:AraC-like DNA-binding protein
MGFTYQQVLDQTRHELAQGYLDDQTKSVTEVAFLLGFSEQSAFTRAFKRWSGISPSGYRAI